MGVTEAVAISALQAYSPVEHPAYMDAFSRTDAEIIEVFSESFPQQLEIAERFLVMLAGRGYRVVPA